MGNNTAWGQNAYRESRRNGGSKEDAKEAQSIASEKYYAHVKNQQYSRVSSDYEDDDSDDRYNNARDWDDFA